MDTKDYLKDLSDRVEQHREESFITCEESCFCYDIIILLDFIGNNFHWR